MNSSFAMKSSLRFFALIGLALPLVAGARVLLVDQRPDAGADYSSLTAAAAEVRPGDVIKIAPGSGPYRETLYITTSGTLEAPITVDGSGEILTGAAPLVFQKSGDGWSCDLASYHTTAQPVQGFTKIDGRWTSKFNPSPLPFVIVHQGKRLRQERSTGQLIGPARLSDDRNTLVLAAGASPEDWEISVRPYVVRTTGTTSHHRYHHIRATGSLNDGFSLHGSSMGLVFEDIEAFNNLDEGFSAHGTVNCTLVRGRFHDNDNGLTNADQSFMKGSDIVCRDNLGFGFYLQTATVEVENLDSAGNGIGQLVLHMGATLRAGRVTLASGGWRDNPWISSQESGQDVRAGVIMKGSRITVTGPEPIILGAANPRQRQSPQAKS